MSLGGDELDPILLAEDASRFQERFSQWGRFGISAFHASSDDEIDAVCQTRLIRFPTVVIFRRKDLELEGIEIVPTFRTPHVTLCHDRLTDLIDRLIRCRHTTLANKYNQTESGGH